MDINTSKRINRQLIRTLLYLIKRCRPKLQKTAFKTKNEERDSQKIFSEMDFWNKKYSSVEKYVEKIIDNNDKVIEDNNYLRLELKKIR